MAHEPVARPQSGYECFIHVHNKTSVDLALDDTGITYGEWAKKSPPNTIEAKSDAIITLNDKFGFYGSEGWAVYEILPPGKQNSVKVRLEFACPRTKFNDNYLHAHPSDPEKVSVNVPSYPVTGSPFVAHVEIYLPSNKDTKENDDPSQSEEFKVLHHVPQPLRTLRDETFKAKFKIGFDGGVVSWQPVHEDIAIAAFILSKLRFPKGTTYNNLDKKQWEYFRGVIWPDDPSCLLFKNLPDSNSTFGLGAEFLNDFWSSDPNLMTQRSHFGNLQFLHGMATKLDEAPNETKAKLLQWFEVMYKLAVGGEGVTENDQLHQWFPGSFSATSTPTGDRTLRDLLLSTTPDYRKVDISRRALGVCLHMIQDSYAVGHTLRRLKNRKDIDGRDEDGNVRFKPKTYAQLGPIITFHTYPGQPDSKHSHYDDSKEERNPKEIETFNHIIGARDAIEKSRALIDFYATKTKWDGGVRAFLADDVFQLDKDVTKSNNQVDERFGLPETSTSDIKGNWDEKEYEAGLARKLALLEEGLAYNQKSPGRWTRRVPGCLRARGLPILKHFLAIVAIFLIFLLSQLAMRFLKL